MTEFTPERLDELQAVCDAATEGPWSWEKLPTGNHRHRVQAAHSSVATVHALIHQKANCEFIALARAVLPAALAEIKRLQAPTPEVSKE